MTEEEYFEEIYQELKQRIITFGERQCFPLPSALIQRDCISIMKNMSKETILPDIPIEIVEDLIGRFISEMDYVKYPMPNIHYTKRNSVFVVMMKKIIDEGLCSSKATLSYKNNVYLDKTIATILKLNS